MYNKMKLPTSFSVNRAFDTDDTRFLNVTIDVMHTGLNLNNSWFDKEVVEDAISTIYNTPILGYINKNDEDFEGHELKLVSKDDSYKVVYAGSAYGVIPESCNPRWTTKVLENGDVKEFLQVDAIMWTKLDDAFDIMQRDIVKNQSMEIVDCEGDFDENKVFKFSKFKFDGCCILSTTDPSIQPAMTGANVTANFSVATCIKDMLNKYESWEEKMNFTCDDRKEENMEEKETVVETEVLETATYETVEETVEEETAVVEETVVEEVAEEETKVEEESVDSNPQFSEEQKEQENTDAENFSLSNKQIVTALYNAVANYRDGEDRWCHYWFVDYQDNEVIYEDYENGALYGSPFIMEKDTPVIDFEVRKKKKYVYEDLEETEETFTTAIVTPIVAEYEEKVKEFEAVKEEFEVIKPKYDRYVELEKEAMAEAESAKKAEVLESYSAYLNGNAEFETLKENVEELSVDEILNKVGILFVNAKLGAANKPTENKKNTVRVKDEEEFQLSAIEKRYGRKINN